MSKYYGCEIVKDENAFKIDNLTTDKDNFLNFITQLRKVTKSDEPLILVPRRWKGKTSSASVSSCHWAVKTLIRQHLGKQFCGFAFDNMSVKLTGLNKEDFTLDNNLNGILGYFHSVWQTPEEQLVNVINMVKSGYRLDKLHSKKNPKFQEAFANFRYPETILMLPTNKYCYYEHTGNTYVTYNDVYFYHKRKVSLFENKGIKKVLKLEKTEPNILPKNSYFNYKKNITDVLEVNDYLNKLAICKNIYQETDFKSINSEIFFRKNYPNLTNNTFWTTNFDKHFKKTTIIIDDYKEAVAQYCNFLKKSDTDEFFTKDIISPQQSWENKKNLFLEPSIVSKKFHYEQSNHPEYDDRIQYRTIDKIDVYDQIKLMIENMSESQKNYENKRAEKHGVTLEDFILKQKYKLAK